MSGTKHIEISIKQGGGLWTVPKNVEGIIFFFEMQALWCFYPLKSRST